MAQPHTAHSLPVGGMGAEMKGKSDKMRGSS